MKIRLFITSPGFLKTLIIRSKFLADQNAWFRYTEGTFDRFMPQQKL